MPEGFLEILARQGEDGGGRGSPGPAAQGLAPLRGLPEGDRREFAFATRNVLLVQLALPGYDVARTRIFHREALERLSALPGVESVGLTSLPEGGEPAKRITVDGGPEQPLDIGFAGVNRFSPGYLETLKIPILHGRNFADADIANDTSVAIVSESMARRYWPNESAVGKHPVPAVQAGEEVINGAGTYQLTTSRSRHRVEGVVDRTEEALAMAVR